MSRFSFRAAGMLLACLFTFGIFAPAAVYADSGYTTDSFDISVLAREDNSFLVTETIRVDFLAESHGIYRYIPVAEDGKIDQISVPGYHFETYSSDGNVVIRIGSSDYTVTGQHEYEIAYRVRLYDDGEPAYDSVYWNFLTPGGWDTDIGSMKISFAMPKAFDPEKIRITRGGYGNTQTGGFTADVEGNTLYAASDAPLMYGEGVTLAIELPEGYFAGEMSSDWALYAMMAAILLPLVAAACLWFFFGRDPKVVQTVEFYPPEGITPAEVGYIIDGACDTKDMLSMIFYFAEKGYLAIENIQTKKNREEILLVKKSELPPEAKTFEHSLFSGLFAEGDSVTLEGLRGTFAPYFAAAVSQLPDHYNQQDETRIFTASSIFARAFSVLLMISPLVSVAVLGSIYAAHEVIYGMLFLIPSVIAAVGYFGLIYHFDRKHSAGKGKNRAARIVLTVVLLMGLGAFAVIGVFGFGLSYQTILALVCSVAAFQFALYMRKRTKSSAALLGKLLGLKEFIRAAELPKLKALAAENPSYFYDVLPYAYVFGLSDKWAKQFEGIEIAPPGWYKGSESYSMFSSMVFMRSFHSVSTNLHSSIVVPAAASDFGSGSGGGFGSGGFGGSFSGGGFGGGGGGRW